MRSAVAHRLCARSGCTTERAANCRLLASCSLLRNGAAPAQIVDQLGLRGAAARGPGGGGGAPAAQPAARRFLMPLNECEFTFNTALEELQKDAYPVPTTHRPARCTGTAVQVRGGVTAGPRCLSTPGTGPRDAAAPRCR